MAGAGWVQGSVDGYRGQWICRTLESGRYSTKKIYGDAGTDPNALICVRVLTTSTTVMRINNGKAVQQGSSV